MKEKIKYIAFFIIGIIIAEVLVMDLIYYITLSIVQTYFKYFLDITMFTLGFIICFNALKNLDKIKDKKIIL